MIATEPTPADDPGKRSLDDPPLGEGTEALWKQLVPIHLFAFGHKQSPFGDGERFDRLHDPSQGQAHPEAKVASIVRVSPDQLHIGKEILLRL